MKKIQITIVYFVLVCNVLFSSELYVSDTIQYSGVGVIQNPLFVDLNPASIAGVYQYGVRTEYQQYNSNLHYIKNDILFYVKKSSFSISNSFFWNFTNSLQKSFYFHSSNVVFSRKIYKFFFGSAFEYTKKIDNQFDIITAKAGIIYPLIQESKNFFMKKLHIGIQTKVNYTIQNQRFVVFFNCRFIHKIMGVV